MHHVILGKRWRIEFVKGFPDPDRFGECDGPHVHNKAIRIKRRLSDEEEIQAVLHEMTHAAGWHIDEEFVTQFAIDAARLLFKLGYRRRNDGNF